MACDCIGVGVVIFIDGDCNVSINLLSRVVEVEDIKSVMGDVP